MGLTDEIRVRLVRIGQATAKYSIRSESALFYRQKKTYRGIENSIIVKEARVTY